ncbi:MAG: type II toxin-antitoxin system VapC family toxin [Gemmatimonadetes bacterium]|nr:type II toxin-antitoxin system VapC family toxin [Gemmatimonadota bacterium]
MKLVDTNILMYAAGEEHANKAASVALLERIARGQDDATIDAEVLQEVLHRYRAIGRWAEGKRVYDMARVIFPVVLPITVKVMDRARLVMDRRMGMMARDALHAAVVLTEKLDGIYSYDTDLDGIPGVERLVPGA